jgi:hypothetical protein
MIIQFILLTLPLITHLIVDWRGVVRHWLNALYVLALSVAAGILLPGYWWQGALFALAIHFTFFDPLYNLTHGHKLFYHGDPRNPGQALTDKQWQRLPAYAEVFIRLWVLVVGYSVYFELDRIISYVP